MRNKLYIILVSALTVVLLAGSAVCEEQKPAQSAERKTLIARLIEKVKGLPFFKKAPAAQKVEEKMAAPSGIPAETKKPAGEAGQVKQERKITKEELLSHIKGMLDRQPEILGKIPEIKKIQGEGENITYTYNGTALDGLSEDTIRKLSVRINQVVTMIQTMRIQKQLESIRQIENLQRMQQQAIRPQPYVPPPVPQPPPPPQPPQAVTQPPPAPPQAQPSPPPQPPQKR